MRLVRRSCGGRRAKGRLQPEPEGLGINRHLDIAIRRDRVLDGRERITTIAA